MSGSDMVMKVEASMFEDVVRWYMKALNGAEFPASSDGKETGGNSSGGKEPELTGGCITLWIGNSSTFFVSSKKSTPGKFEYTFDDIDARVTKAVDEGATLTKDWPPSARCRRKTELNDPFGNNLVLSASPGDPMLPYWNDAVARAKDWRSRNPL